MKKLLIATATFLGLIYSASFSAPAMATFYNATFDCGGGQTVWIGNPVEGHGAERQRKVIFMITISHFNFVTAPVVRSPVVVWNSVKDKVTLDGRPCRLLTDEDEANKHEFPIDHDE